MGFAKFMAGSIGRALRILVGAAMVLYGMFGGVQGIGGLILILVGLVPLYAGVMNVCFVAPLINAPFSGKKALES